MSKRKVEINRSVQGNSKNSNISKTAVASNVMLFSIFFFSRRFISSDLIDRRARCCPSVRLALAGPDKEQEELPALKHFNKDRRPY